MASRSLPQEIINQIVQVLIQGADRKCISAYAATSRSFYWPVTEHRFSTISFNELTEELFDDRARQFASFAREHPHILPFIRLLSLTFAYYDRKSSMLKRASPLWSVFDILEESAINLKTVELASVSTFSWVEFAESRKKVYRLLIGFLRWISVLEIRFRGRIIDIYQPTELSTLLPTLKRLHHTTDFYMDIGGLFVPAGSTSLGLLGGREGDEVVVTMDIKRWSHASQASVNAISHSAQILKLRYKTLKDWTAYGIAAPTDQLHILNIFLDIPASVQDYAEFENIARPLYAGKAETSKIHTLSINIRHHLSLGPIIKTVALPYPTYGPETPEKLILAPRTWSMFHPSKLREAHPRLTSLSVRIDIPYLWPRLIWVYMYSLKEDYVKWRLEHLVLHRISNGKKVVDGCTVDVQVSFKIPTWFQNM